MVSPRASLPPCTGVAGPSPALRMTRCRVCRTEIFSGKSVAHEDIHYEQACVLYNLGEPPASPAAGDGAWAGAGRTLYSDPPLPPTSLPAPPFWASGSHLLGRGSMGLLPRCGRCGSDWTAPNPPFEFGLLQAEGKQGWAQPALLST